MLHGVCHLWPAQAHSLITWAGSPTAQDACPSHLQARTRCRAAASRSVAHSPATFPPAGEVIVRGWCEGGAVRGHTHLTFSCDTSSSSDAREEFCRQQSADNWCTAQQYKGVAAQGCSSTGCGSAWLTHVQWRGQSLPLLQQTGSESSVIFLQDIQFLVEV